VRTELREALAAGQARLLAALLARGEAPPGFDAGRLAVAAEGLRRKRARAAARAWPALERRLEGRFEPLFFEYAGGNPLRSPGPLADARRFEAWLRRRNIV